MTERDYPGITGNLEILSWKERDEEFDEEWIEVSIHGDPEGLRSLAKLLNSIADLDQNTLEEIPGYAREHVHLQPDTQLSGNSAVAIIGRLDPKNGGDFHKGFRERKNTNYTPTT